MFDVLIVSVTIFDAIVIFDVLIVSAIVFFTCISLARILLVCTLVVAMAWSL